MYEKYADTDTKLACLTRWDLQCGSPLGCPCVLVALLKLLLLPLPQFSSKRLVGSAGFIDLNLLLVPDFMFWGMFCVDLFWMEFSPKDILYL